MKTDPAPASAPRVRLRALGLWGAIVLAGLGYFLLHPSQFTAQEIAAALKAHSDHILAAYFTVSVARAFFLIPSTPFVLAGALLMPDRPWAVLLISLTGIAVSSTLIYGFSDWLGLRAHFERLSPAQLQRMQDLLNSRFGFLILAAWAFFPLVPTDAACYAAGVIRMNFGKFLLGVCTGEAILCTLYVYLGGGARSLLDSWLL